MLNLTVIERFSEDQEARSSKEARQGFYLLAQEVKEWMRSVEFTRQAFRLILRMMAQGDKDG